ncbi:hypothetical protein K402DRAFT_394374 [Aulographum hederae CBS 113979]|uniref:Mediator of RNA polymerase II transcription subunit 4 n=1 Tax=Aulographum hederae CBS 113979 TaxID=1176131 RepID=A0A6G1GY72_9PEZI|nr:hypothetical protein K402DRAFT_394374 [Aulographum hederae CBS 113979]
MNTLLQTRLQRVDTALSTLIESFTTFNPNPAVAVDLVAADDGLSDGLEELVHHQANHRRILSLRRTIQSLEEELKSSLRIIADTRKELIETKINPIPSGLRKVPYEKLLAYASRLPPTTINKYQPGPPPAEDAMDAGEEKAIEEQDANGVASTDNAGDTEAMPPTAPQTYLPRDVTSTVGFEQLPQGHQEWIRNIHSNYDPSEEPFTPWPNHRMVLRTGLASIQAIRESGRDPATVLTAEEEMELAAKRRIAEEAEERAKKEEQKRDQELAAQQQRERQAQQAAQKPVLGGLDLYNPDESDEDD